MPGPVRLLVIAAAEVDRLAIRHALEQGGLTITGLDEAMAADTGLVQAAMPYDCLIIDQDLPGTPGIALTQKLRERDIKTPVVLLTAGHDDELLPYPLQRLAVAPFRFAAAAADHRELQALPAGQGASLIRDRRPAGEVLHRLVEETVACLRQSRERIVFGA